MAYWPFRWGLVRWFPDLASVSSRRRRPRPRWPGLLATTTERCGEGLTGLDVDELSYVQAAVRCTSSGGITRLVLDW